MQGTIQTRRVSLRDVFKTFNILPSTSGKVSVSNLFDETEWNLVDIPKKNTSKMPVGFFRGKTIVEVWHEPLTPYPSNAMTFYIQTLQDEITYKVTFSSYENFFLYPPHLLLDQNTSTFSRSLPNVYDATGRYKGGGRSTYYDVDDVERVANGEWIQIDLDVFIYPLKVVIHPAQGKEGECPSKLLVIGLDKDMVWRQIAWHDYSTTVYKFGSSVDFLIQKIIPCSSYRLICLETSKLSSLSCNTFSLSDARMWGVSKKSRIPSVLVEWQNGVKKTLTSNVIDLSILGDNLDILNVKTITCSQNARCTLYTGFNFTKTSVTVRNGETKNVEGMFCSLKIENTNPESGFLPFDFEGMKHAFMFGDEKVKKVDDYALTPCNGNLSSTLDAVRGYVLRLSFGPTNLNVPSLDVNQFYTIMFWMKRSNISTANVVDVTSLYMDSASLISAGVSSNGNVVFKHDNVTLFDNVLQLTEFENKWIHYATSFDGNTFRLYKNGVLHAFTDVVTPWSGSTGFDIGKQWRNSQETVLIDNIRIYDRAINPVTLKNLFDFEFYNPTF